MLDKSKSSKNGSKNIKDVEQNSTEIEGKSSKTGAKRSASTSLKEKETKIKSNVKKATTKETKELESKEILPKAIEKKPDVKNEVKAEVKKTVKKTTAKKTAAKNSTKAVAKQEKNVTEKKDEVVKIESSEKVIQIEIPKKEIELGKEKVIEAAEKKSTTTKKAAVTTRKTAAKATTAKTNEAATKTTAVKKTTTRTAKAKATTEKIETKAKSTAETIKQTVKKVVEKVNKSEITNFNTFLFHQGKNYDAYNILGSHIGTDGQKKGVQFATWAPNAKEIYVVGDFNEFEIDDKYKLERVSENGLWKGFFEKVKLGDRYKYCIISNDGEKGEFKADPYAIQTELRPDSASIVYEPKEFKWTDEKWIEYRNNINVLEEPLNIYEVHLGSWRTREDGEFLTYEEIAKKLPKYVKEMGYTHVEIMPLVEHPLDASWGYQGTGYYSPTSRYGKIEGLKKLIDKLHELNIGVIMDWAPGHFCKDSHGLYKFDGTPTYEYQEEWRAENRGWGTCNFDLGRPEVKSYLISNALYWFREFHVDGLRVDAVSSILYLDYSRSHGEWVPNKYGGNGNLEAIDFLKELNKAVFIEYPTALMIAEESTAWPNITKPTNHDGLGFNLKWNMGWMNDTLEYVQIDPLYRSNNHRNITFAMMYNYAENYLLPLSHDEVVHGKKSLINKMWGDEWNRFAGLRAFMGYMIGHPGKKLTFMGCEFAQPIEWREYEELEWNVIEDIEIHKKTHLFFKELNHLYLDNRSLWELDHDYRGFNWIEADNSEQSILIFNRRSRNDEDTLVFIINFTSTVYYDYRIGVPFLGEYKEIFNTDDERYGGSGQVMGENLFAEKVQFQDQPYSLKIKVPPMATLVLKVTKIAMEQQDAIEEIEELKESSK
jgi:alpha-1,4-glucan:alpha-1,4-glucan 6-glycosyltransferase